MDSKTASENKTHRQTCMSFLRVSGRNPVFFRFPLKNAAGMTE